MIPVKCRSCGQHFNGIQCPDCGCYNHPEKKTDSSTGHAPKNTEMNGSHATSCGRVYLSIMTRKDFGEYKWVDHGMSLAEAVSIRTQLDIAISKAAEIETGRQGE